MKHTVAHVAESAISNPVIVQTVAATTAGLGAAGVLDLIKSGLGIVAVAVGITLSIVMLVKNRYDYRVARARRQEEILEREAKGLPVRRSTDV